MGATRELGHLIRVNHILDAGVVAATFTSTAIDTQGWESTTFIWNVGVWTAGTFTPSLKECATSGGTYTAVDNTQIEVFQVDANAKMQRLGNGSTLPVVSSTATDQTDIVFAYVGGYLRFLKAVLTGASSPSCGMGLVCVQSHPRESVGIV